MYNFAREVLIPHLETNLGWKCPVVNVTTFIGTIVDVEKKQCWHRDISLSYVTGPDQHHPRCSGPHPMMVVLGILCCITHGPPRPLGGGPIGPIGHRGCVVGQCTYCASRRYLPFH